MTNYVGILTELSPSTDLKVSCAYTRSLLVKQPDLKPEHVLFLASIIHANRWNETLWLDSVQKMFKQLQHLYDPDLPMLPVSDLTVFLSTLNHFVELGLVTVCRNILVVCKDFDNALEETKATTS